MTRTHLIVLVALSVACGDDPCPPGEMLIGAACIPSAVDGGPAPEEVCNGLDDDSDGQVDEADPNLGAACGENVGICTTGTLACVEGTLVCSGVLPGDEICNVVDDDCDGNVDEMVQLTFYLDEDGDTFGGDMTCDACAVEECGEGNWVAVGGDCDDTCETCFEGGTEVCDTFDNDCDFEIDEDVQTLIYPDGDLDGFGVGEGVLQCEASVGFATAGGDCADGDARAFPGATEYYETPIMGDGPELAYDFDCDGSESSMHFSCVPNDTCFNDACYLHGIEICGAPNETQRTGIVAIFGMPDRCIALSEPSVPSRTACR